MTLLADYTRCAGHTEIKPGGIGFRSDCLTCERRLAGIADRTGDSNALRSWVNPPTQTPCPMEIRGGEA